MMNKIIDAERMNECLKEVAELRPKRNGHGVPGKLVELYDGSVWCIYRQDAGMGEHDYAVFLNDVFFCRTEHLITAKEIIESVRYRANHDLVGGEYHVTKTKN